jgi:cytoskeletal protein CcmA (bactofilin family)
MWNNQQDTSKAAASLGGSIFVKGEINGSEDLTVDGRVEGRIDLPEHALTIGPNAKIEATITAKVVTIFGSVTGTITAREKVDVRSSATVQGIVTCGRIAVQEGATVNGKIETKLMSKSKNQAGSTKAA